MSHWNASTIDNLFVKSLMDITSDYNSLPVAASGQMPVYLYGYHCKDKYSMNTVNSGVLD